MFESIVVPLDGSPLAERILGQVRRLLFYKDAKVLLVRALEYPPALEETLESLEVRKAKALKYLGEVAERLSSQGARVETCVREGNPANVILGVVKEEHASLITMSTHGRGGLSRWVWGSVAEKILRASPVPVLAVRSFEGSAPGAVPRGHEELTLQKILVPIEFSDLSLEVIPPALELAKLFGSRVLLYHAYTSPEFTIPVPQMEKARERFLDGGVWAEPLLERGDPAERILDTSQAQGADLIAMTTHGRAGVSRWMFGSVTEKVLRSARVPMLIVRAGKETSGNLSDRTTRAMVEPV